MLRLVLFFVTRASVPSLSPLFFSPLQGTRTINFSVSVPLVLFTENGGPGLASVTDALSRPRRGAGLRDDGVREVRH